MYGVTTLGESLWLKWVQHHYLKEASIWVCKCKSDCTWYWKRILKARDMLREWFNTQTYTWLDGKRYSIAEGYKWLVSTQQRVQWADLLWHKLRVPKFSYVTWLAMHGRLQTLDRLKAYGVQLAHRWFLCRQRIESNGHLFFSCSFTAAIAEQLIV